MGDILLKPLEVLHYAKMIDVDEQAILDSNSPLVVIHFMTDNENKHLQVRVLPFNSNNVEKEELPFSERMQYYKKEIRNFVKSTTTYESIPESDILATIIEDYFTEEDGFDDEFAEFMDGWNTTPITGYEDNMMGFFIDNYLGLSINELNEFALGMTS